MHGQEFARFKYDPKIERGRLPGPIFVGLDWQGMRPGEEQKGRILSIDGASWEITVAGFQSCVGTGHSVLHQEATEMEEMYMVEGEGKMLAWDGSTTYREYHGNYWETKLVGALTRGQASRANFTLAVACDMGCSLLPRGREYTVLNIEVDGQTSHTLPAFILPGYSHSAVFTKPSLYFVMKRKIVVK